MKNQPQQIYSYVWTEPQFRVCVLRTKRLSAFSLILKINLI